VTISVGGTVTWVNNDAVAHTSTASGQWDSGILQPGGRFSRTFPVAGSFPYLCTLHPNMVGTVNVQ
jgi:plastocyanin